MNILIVDDDQIDRKVVKRTLERSDSDYSVQEAGDILTAYDLIASNDFDAIIIDYMMPEKTGIELIMELRDQPELDSVALIMMSASDNEDLAITCLEAGAQDFLNKTEITKVALRKSLIHARTRYNLEKTLVEKAEQISNLAETESLTGISNRNYFDEVLDISMLNLQDDYNIALILVDIDNFKLINDIYNNDVGDCVLKHVAQVLSASISSSEVVGRLGADEFGIILSNVKHLYKLTQYVNLIRNSLLEDINVCREVLNITVSIGIALYRKDASNKNELKRFATLALHKAKVNGRDQIAFFEEEMQSYFADRLKIEMALREAIKNEKFELYFQPIHYAYDNAIQGFEALIRWPESGYTPDKFIPIAEECFLIQELGKWIIKTAFKHLAKWNKYPKADSIHISINLSPVQLNDPTLLDYMEDLVEELKINTKHVILEVTETALFNSAEDSSEVLKELATRGFNIALDDFGTGYSSISHLIKFPINIVKLDKSIMPSEDSGHKVTAVFKGLVFMLSAMEMIITAEGVETEEQKDLCKDLGVTKLQGYFFSRPLSAKQIEQKLSSIYA